MKKGHEKKEDSGWNQAGLAMSIPTLMVTGPLVGFLFGYGAVKYFDLQPPWSAVVKIGLLILGVAAGIRESIKVIKRVSSGE